MQFNGIMHGLTVDEPYCNPAASWGDASCGVSLATTALFWTVFYTVAALIHLHFLTALLLEGYRESSADPTDASGAFTLTHAAADAFTDAWAALDVYSSQRLSFEDAALVIARVDAPLGLRRVHAESDASSPARARMSRLRIDEAHDVVSPETAQGFLRSLRVPDLRVGTDQTATIHFLPLLEALLDRASTKPPLGHRHHGQGVQSRELEDASAHVGGAGDLRLRDLAAAADRIAQAAGVVSQAHGHFSQVVGKSVAAATAIPVLPDDPSPAVNVQVADGNLVAEPLPSSSASQP